MIRLLFADGAMACSDKTDKHKRHWHPRSWCDFIAAIGVTSERPIGLYGRGGVWLRSSKPNHGDPNADDPELFGSRVSHSPASAPMRVMRYRRNRISPRKRRMADQPARHRVRCRSQCRNACRSPCCRSGRLPVCRQRPPQRRRRQPLRS